MSQRITDQIRIAQGDGNGGFTLTRRGLFTLVPGVIVAFTTSLGSAFFVGSYYSQLNYAVDRTAVRTAVALKNDHDQDERINAIERRLIRIETILQQRTPISSWGTHYEQSIYGPMGPPLLTDEQRADHTSGD